MKLDQEYDRDDLINFLKNDFLPNFTKDIRPINQGSNTKTINSAIYLGACSEFDLQVFELETSGKSDKKISQALDSFRLLKEYQSYRALVAYYSKDDSNWRFALLQMTPDLSDKGKIVNKYSNPRRYSFLLGPHAKIRTPEKYLITDGLVKDFEDLQRRFSVEVVNKDFYREIARFFIRLVGGDTKLGSKTEHFKPELHLPSIDADDHKTYQEYTVRLIGRIIFCWFLKQKKSQEGISLLPEEFLSSNAVKNTDNYYHSILEPIFFEVLNKPKESRKPQFRNGYDRIPYLNGGLFDPHYDDFYEGQPSFALKIPNEWFIELFEVLETYNFTIDENTSLDVDLSIDPEMLGRIFENLLAEINPETGESARKSTGSYYTPRQIVEYMVDQSLIQYLLTKTEIDKQKLEALISVDTDDDEKLPLNDEEKRKVVNALDEVKIIDPACGSGAFPIGILQKIVWILGKVDTNGKLWFDKKLENLDPLLHDDFRQKFQNENFDYIRKTGVIRDSIYGVDIQPIAVEVSKLRSFLTLIVDEDIDETLTNRGIKPLPNLEFKFVAANSLMNLPDSTNSGNRQVGMFDDDNEIDQLKKLRDLYFVSNGFEKEKIKSRFKDVQKEMFKNQVNKGGHGKLTMALADWDPFSNKSSKWFDPEWMFGFKEFDIAIANPPYISHVNFNNQEKQLLTTAYETFSGRADIYVAFYEKGIKLLKFKGTLTYITPNKFFRAGYGAQIRKYLEANAMIISIVDFGDSQIFDATTYPAVLVIRRESGQKYNLDYVKSDSITNFSQAPNLVKFENNYLKNNLWSFDSHKLDSIWNKMRNGSISLSEYIGGQFYRGIVTGLNEAFIIDETIKNKIIRENPEAAEIIKPYLKGRDSKRWRSKTNLYILFTYHGIEIEKYPAVENYLSKFKDKLLRRATSKNHKWFELQQPQTGIYSYYEKSKIISTDIANRCEFTIDKTGAFIDATIFCIPKEDLFLLAILNSFLIESFYRSISSTVRGDFLRFKKIYMDTLPIKVTGDKDAFCKIVEKILDISKIDNYLNNSIEQKRVKELEHQINQMVYKLYDLTPDEIKIIEDSMK